MRIARLCSSEVHPILPAHGEGSGQPLVAAYLRQWLDFRNAGQLVHHLDAHVLESLCETCLTYAIMALADGACD